MRHLNLRTATTAAFALGTLAVLSVNTARATPVPSWSALGTGPGSVLGSSVASAGDVNGDGYGDVVVGAPGHIGPVGGWEGEGAAMAYHGSAAGLGVTPVWSATGSADGNWFGYPVVGVGDVNGDGYDDVVVGEPLYTNGEYHEGAAHLYLGSPTGLGPVPSWSYEGNQADGHFGFSVAAAGDVDGDGYADVLVGGFGMSGAVPGEGLAHLFLGGPAGLLAVPSWVVGSGQAGSAFGRALAGGDVNGDGFSDVVVGAYNYTHDQANEGVVAIYFGSAAGPVSSPSVVLQGNRATVNGGYGIDVASAGDVNSDGYDDILVGDSSWSNPEESEGRVLLYLGSAVGPASAPSWSAEANQGFANLGAGAGAGDVNSDGFDDVVLGVPSDARSCGLGVDHCGSVTLLLGGPTGSLSYAVTAFGTEYLEHFGSDAASAGDVNGDGLPDVIVGASGHDGGVGEFAGAAFVYHGR